MKVLDGKENGNCKKKIFFYFMNIFPFSLFPFTFYFILLNVFYLNINIGDCNHWASRILNLGDYKKKIGIIRKYFGDNFSITLLPSKRSGKYLNVENQLHQFSENISWYCKQASKLRISAKNFQSK